MMTFETRVEQHVWSFDPDDREIRDEYDGSVLFDAHNATDEQAQSVCREHNSHDDLVAALADCIESLSRLPDVDGAYRVTVMQQARAALRRAREEE